MAIVLRCVVCGIALTRPVEPLDDASLLCPEDGRPYVPEGRLWLSDGDYYPIGEWALNLADLVNTRHHPDGRRLNGCCGLDGCDGINRVCANGHEVGTERSDCWWAPGIHFAPGRVIVTNG